MKIDWRLALPLFGVEARYLVNRHGPCPLCGGKDRFRFDDKDGCGTWICNRCGAGDGVKLAALAAGITVAETLRRLRELEIAPPPATREAGPLPGPQDLERRRTALQRAWDEASPLAPGDPAALYLEGRIPGFAPPYPPELRCHPGLPYSHGGVRYGRLPALLARVRDPSGRPVNVHRIYLAPDGRKAEVPAPKKLMRGVARATGGAVRLYPAREVIAVAEGVETALAVRAMTRLPVWACVSATLMKSLAVPEAVREVRIYADHDESGTGQEAAEKLRRRLLRQGIKARVFLPERPGTDFLDEWAALAKTARAA